MPKTLGKAVDLVQILLNHDWLKNSCALLCLGWTLGGCSQATGPYFSPAEHLEPDQTIVYLYFPQQSGFSDHYTILANGTTVTRLDEGGYYPFRTSPGRITFSMYGFPEKRNLTVAVEPGNKYFLKVALIGQGTFTYNRYYQLFLMSKEIADGEISQLRLMATCPTTEGCANSLK